MTRKNLNDVIHGDRALVRGYRAQPAKFDDWKYGQDAEPYDASRTATTYYSGSKSERHVLLPLAPGAEAAGDRPRHLRRLLPSPGRHRRRRLHRL